MQVEEGKKMADEKEISNAFGNDVEDAKDEKTVDQTENQVKDETKGNSDDVKDESKMMILQLILKMREPIPKAKIKMVKKKCILKHKSMQ